MISEWTTMAATIPKTKEPPHEQQRLKTLQGRRTPAQPGAHDIRYRFDHRLAELVGHGHGPGGLAAQGHSGDRRATAAGVREGSAGPAGAILTLGPGRGG